MSEVQQFLHDSVFPHTHDVDPHKQQRWVDLMLYCQDVENAIARLGVNSQNFDVVVLALRLLEELCQVVPARNYFVDGFSNGGAVAIAALKFGYSKVSCLEMSKASAVIAKTVYQKMAAQEDGASPRRLTITTGSIQDYLPTETSILFLNCCELSPHDSSMDEGTLVNNALNVCKLLLLQGSTVVILTKYLALDSHALKLMGLSQKVRLIYSVLKSVDIGCNIWILQTQ
jgi:hypothetical protein